MTLRKLAQDPRVARAFSEDAGFGRRRYWVELADGFETDAGGTSLSEDSIEELWESLRELVRPVRAARRNPDPHAEVEALYRDFARERDRIAVALGEGYGSVLGCWDEEPCPDDDLDRVRRAGAYLANYDPEIFKQTKRGRELREDLRAWVRWLAWMANQCEERVAQGWWVEGGGWEAPRGHGRR